MEFCFTVLGKLPGLNDYIRACRTNPYVGAKMKHDSEKLINRFILPVKGGLTCYPYKLPVEIEIAYYEANKRRDPDNVSGYARKVIFDALVNAGVLKDDGQDEIKTIRESWAVDRENPRIEIKIKEAETCIK